MAGVTTSASSRAYESFNAVTESTAESLQKLVDLGAVLVEKTKTAQFASGEGPMDWVDFSCPFNPRGDGYLNPSGSSTGSAAAVAGYSWLDSAVGCDTLGSILCPAASQGIYGIRPSHGLISSEGVVGVSSMLDTPGPFSRSIEGLHELGKAWYGANWKQTTSKFPTQVLYATEFFEEFDSQRRDIMDGFVMDLQKATGIDRVDFDLAATWDAYVDVKYERPVQKFLENTLAHIQLYDAYKSRVGFLQAFKAKHGHEPYANPMVRFKWLVNPSCLVECHDAQGWYRNLGLDLTETDYEEACEQRNVFRNFFEQHVFTEDTVMVLPAGKPTLNTRDDYGEGTFEQRGRSMQGFGFRCDMFSYLGSLPMLVLPMQSTSTVAGEDMYEPVSVSLVGAHGADGLLMELAKMIISSSGRMSSVQTGKTAFDV